MNLWDIRSAHTRAEHPDQSNYSMHTHDKYELLYIIHGHADFSVEGNIYHIKKGDLILVRKSESHYIYLRSSAYYERILVSFNIAKNDMPNNDLDNRLASMIYDQSLGKYNLFSGDQFPDNHWLYYLNRICEYKDAETQALYLMALLNEMAEKYELVQTTSAADIPCTASAVIEYINRHLFENLSLENICTQFYLSESQMNRIFKKATCSTVWNYITIKRLLHAKELLQSGEKPTVVSEKCGFQNYVSFYKAYRKQFGHAPKEDSI